MTHAKRRARTRRPSALREGHQQASQALSLSLYLYLSLSLSLSLSLAILISCRFFFLHLRRGVSEEPVESPVCRARHQRRRYGFVRQSVLGLGQRQRPGPGDWVDRSTEEARPEHVGRRQEGADTQWRYHHARLLQKVSGIPEGLHALQGRAARGAIGQQEIPGALPQHRDGTQQCHRLHKRSGPARGQPRRHRREASQTWPDQRTVPPSEGGDSGGTAPEARGKVHGRNRGGLEQDDRRCLHRHLPALFHVMQAPPLRHPRPDAVILFPIALTTELHLFNR